MDCGKEAMSLGVSLLSEALLLLLHFIYIYFAQLRGKLSLTFSLKNF